MDFSKFEEIAQISFHDKALLKQAFTHRSYINENRPPAGGSGLAHNERLEFLGDAVLELVTTTYLYKNYPEMDEGELTVLRSALVNADTCASVATSLGANDFLLLSKGESKEAGGRARQYILANTLEALIGAIYLDQGLESAERFINLHITTLADGILREGSWIDAKSLLQEKAQENSGITPAYKTIKESGPDHDKKFTVGVYLNDEQFGEGHGQSKQDAEQGAARDALKQKGWS